jgi:hypothetical protein
LIYTRKDRRVQNFERLKVSWGWGRC